MSEEKAPSRGKNDDGVSRRDLLGRLGVGVCIGAGGLCAAGLANALLPRVIPEPSQTFKIGPVDDYPVGTARKFERENVWVFRDEAGLFAISAVCTHLGCIVTQAEDGSFECPCHGSTFTADGNVTKGPAPSALPWLKVTQLPDGQLAVDRGARVPLGEKVTL